MGTEGETTKRKIAEDVLKLFSKAVDEAADGIQIVDLDGYITYSNKAVERIYGFSHEEYEGKHVNEMNADPEIASRVILPTIKKEGRWAGELIVKHKDGYELPVWLSASMVKDKKGEPIAVVGIISDITEHKRAEEELKLSKEFVETILDSMDDAISIIDVRDFKIVGANRVFKTFMT
jgi:PAS domain S-box-containing protein